MVQHHQHGYPLPFGSKKHSVSWLTTRTDAVFFPASGEKLDALSEAPTAFCRVNKMQQRYNMSLSSLAVFCFILQATSDYVKSARYRDLAPLLEMKTATCQKLCQFLPTRSSSSSILTGFYCASENTC